MTGLETDLKRAVVAKLRDLGFRVYVTSERRRGYSKMPTGWPDVFVRHVERRMCVIEGTSTHGAQPDAVVLVNPQLLEWTGKQVGWETCLSIPGSRVRVRRARRIVVQTQDLAGQLRRILAEDLEARTIQHEIDHLNGILIIDQSSKLRLQRRSA